MNQFAEWRGDSDCAGSHDWLSLVLAQEAISTGTEIADFQARISVEGWKVQLSLGREQEGTTDHNRDAEPNTFKKTWKETGLTGQRELSADHLWVQMWLL